MTLDKRLTALEAAQSATEAAQRAAGQPPVYRIDDTDHDTDGEAADGQPAAEGLRARLRRLVTLYAARPGQAPAQQWYSADAITGRRLWHVRCPADGAGDLGAEYVITASDDPSDLYTPDAPDAPDRPDAPEGNVAHERA